MYPDQNLYEIFSIPFSYDVDRKDLKKRYRSLQLEYHPDKQVHSTESEKFKAIQQSSLINDAFQILSSPLKRAKYIGHLAGIDMQKNRHIEAHILMEQMTLREELDDLKQGGLVENQQALISFSESVFKQLADIKKHFSELSGSMFEKGTYGLAENVSEELVSALQQCLSEMLFLEKLYEDVSKFIESDDE